ncbi:hypothetical protein CERZMDRAFT_85503 [Cercospora zeae-maydis SCOH1-5]|uniref:Uncharacterized protein n=1 Tax=Cercospora zeae-maydis SCOH1-5 TaxID=717836 RepID=A0A6A6FD69_9PEZI|nr:hypothetical protein CERZMDRAFT_85503 [Cercospora zeae-maydis SCOH1-5]
MLDARLPDANPNGVMTVAVQIPFPAAVVRVAGDGAKGCYADTTYAHIAAYSPPPALPSQQSPESEMLDSTFRFASPPDDISAHCGRGRKFHHGFCVCHPFSSQSDDHIAPHIALTSSRLILAPGEIVVEWDSFSNADQLPHRDQMSHRTPDAGASKTSLVKSTD